MLFLWVDKSPKEQNKDTYTSVLIYGIWYELCVWLVAKEEHIQWWEKCVIHMRKMGDYNSTSNHYFLDG